MFEGAPSLVLPDYREGTVPKLIRVCIIAPSLAFSMRKKRERGGGIRKMNSGLSILITIRPG